MTQFTSMPVVNWLLLAFLLITLVSVVMTANAWRQTQQSFHLFSRREAEISMQNYMTVTVILIVIMMLFGGYMWIDSSSRFGRVETDGDEVVATDNTPTPLTTDSLANSANSGAMEQVNASTTTTTRIVPSPSPSAIPLPSATPHLGLPSTYNYLVPDIGLGDETSISRLAFANTLGSDNRPISPTIQFSSGIDRLYATFDYANMVDGMVWSWVWRFDSEVVDGGTQMWQYGTSGPAWVYISPPDGFEPGRYSAEIWINEKLFARSHVTLFADSGTATVDGVAAEDSVAIVSEPQNEAASAEADALPDRYNTISPKADLSAEAMIDLISFQATPSENDGPLSLSATFEHTDLDLGVALSWLWRYEDQVISGGNKLWAYTGDDPIGLIQFVPSEQLRSGEYSVELWINGERLSHGIIDVTIAETTLTTSTE